MKHWKVSYAIRNFLNESIEDEIIIEAGSIGVALNKAYKKLNEIIDTEKFEYVIWDIGIIEDNVW